MARELCGECGWHAGRHNAGCSIGEEMEAQRFADAERRRARAEERQRGVERRRAIAQMRRDEREAERQADASDSWAGTDDQPVHMIGGARRRARSSSGDRRPARRRPELVREEGPSGTSMVAGICSFFVPGLGQLLQGRAIAGIAFFFAAVALWLIFMGWAVALVAAFEAAVWRPPLVSRR